MVLKDKVVVYDLVRQRIGWAEYDCELISLVSFRYPHPTLGEYDGEIMKLQEFGYVTGSLEVNVSATRGGRSKDVINTGQWRESSSKSSYTSDYYYLLQVVFLHLLLSWNFRFL